MKKHAIVRMVEGNGGQEVFSSDGLTQECRKAKVKVHQKEYLKAIENQAYLYYATFGCCYRVTLLACQEMSGLEYELAYKAVSLFAGGVVGIGEFLQHDHGWGDGAGLRVRRTKRSFDSFVNSRSSATLKLHRWFKETQCTVSCRDLTDGFELLDSKQIETFLAPTNPTHEQRFHRCGAIAWRVAEIICEQGSRKIPITEEISK